MSHLRTPTPIRRLVLGGSAAALLALLATSCTASATPQSKSNSVTTITLYSGQHQQTTDSLVQGFEARHPNIKVNVRNNDEDTFDAEIVAEGSRSPADVFFTENSPPLEYLQKNGLLARVNASTLARTPSKYNSPLGDWVAISGRVSVLIYNPSLIKKSQLPTTALGLADSKYKGKLGMAPGETDFQPVVTAVNRAYGKTRTIAWLNALKANARDYADNETLADEVNRGQIAFGLVNQYYWYRMKAEIGAGNVHSALAYFSPHDPGYVIDVSGAGMLKSSKHEAAAQMFLSYLVSKPAQQIIGSPSKSISFEYPLASGVTTLAPEIPFKNLQPYSITIPELGTGAEAIALLRQAQLL